MRYRWLSILILCLVVLWIKNDTEACTSFRLKAKDGTVFYGRTLEYGIELESQIIIVPRGTKFTGTVDGGRPGLAWETKYGFVAVNFYGSTNETNDGMNEKGLTVGLLLFPGYAGFQKVTPDEEGRAIGNLQVVTWILGNFATVDEVRSGIGKIKVVAQTMGAGPQSGSLLPSHYVVHDRRGNCIVIEYEGAELKIYDNPLGVLTNSPPFQWQIINLKNYVNLRPENAAPLDFSGIEITQAGQGSGMRGLPADITPPSRFVKATFLTQTALQPANAEESMIATSRILNVFSIPKGLVHSDEGGKVEYEYSQWEVVGDLGNLRYYFRTYGNMNLRMIDLNEIDFGPGKVKHIRMDQQETFPNVTRDAF